VLQLTSASIFVASLVAFLTPSNFGDNVGRFAVLAVVATPIVRIAWLVVWWWRERDALFVFIGVLLLAVVGLPLTLVARSGP
jgi:hypothetical protein